MRRIIPMFLFNVLTTNVAIAADGVNDYGTVTTTTTTETRSALSQTAPQLSNDLGSKDRIKQRHGFRVGYTYLDDVNELVHPHVMLMGYEAQQVLGKGEIIDVMFVENVLVGGLNQNLAVPTVNALAGVEILERFQIGFGVNGTMLPPDELDPLNIPQFSVGMIAAVGVAIPIEDVYEVPINVSWTAEDDGIGRIAISTGINWVGPH